MRVRTDVVLDVLVGSIHAAAAERATGEGLEWLRSMGWHARALERERFAVAREPIDWPADADASALAEEEPLERPGPDTAPSWRVPGPGGHVRHYLAMRAVREVGVDDRLAAKRAWMQGFFEHCLREPVS